MMKTLWSAESKKPARAKSNQFKRLHIAGAFLFALTVIISKITFFLDFY